jgi:hypothetical protein
LQVSGIGVFESDLNSGELIWDERVRTMYGKPFDTAIEVDEWERSLLPEDSLAAEKAVGDAVASKGTFNSQFRIVRTDGEVRSIRTSGTYYVDDEGRPKVLGANLGRSHMKKTLRGASLIVAMSSMVWLSGHQAKAYSYQYLKCEQIHGTLCTGTHGYTCLYEDHVLQCPCDRSTGRYDCGY